ncbi:MAG: Holliday junction branch migration protein RuvA, partial [Calditrichaeota bacterium]|nr:Holliday junction branch migration protein RuvA [Calditrichota bacterium]
MIDRISGKLIKKTVSEAVVDVGGVGFALTVTLGTYENLGKLGETVTLITYLHVREDILDLYGFESSSERDLFITLLKISGVGPKLALAILSRFGPNQLVRVVADQDVKMLTTVSGIGKRTAEKLLVDLKSRLKVKHADVEDIPGGEASATTEAVRALEVLGYPIAKADDAIRAARKKLGS